jgi:predicted nucleotide-binding protein
MAKSRSRTPSGPTLQPAQAIAVLTANLDAARKMVAPRLSQEKFDSWAAVAHQNLKGAFGEESSQAQEFDAIIRGTYPIGIMVSGGGYHDNTDYDQVRSRALNRALPLLDACIENLKILYPASPPPPVSPSRTSREVFIVHGHDETLKLEAARFVEGLGLKVVILSEQANKGRTVIEKFEAHAGSAGFAIVLLTPDDFGGAASGAPESRPRARQNVILELGYFIGKLGRTHVCALYKGNLELPSDIDGFVYIKHEGHWKLELAKELKAVWPEIDMNKAL